MFKPHQEYLFIVEILTGYCKLNYHLVKLVISKDTACRFYKESGKTSAHVLGQCLVIVQRRLRHLEEYLIPDARLKHLGSGVNTKKKNINMHDATEI